MRRLVAALGALALAAVGTVVLVAYVQGADARALEGARTVEVLVVEQPIPLGTPGEEVGELVRTELIPVKAAAAGRVEDLAELAGQVAAVELVPGEQLLAARFTDPSQLGAAGTVPVPEGMQEVSVLLDPQRAAGGRLAAGDTVGVYLSLRLTDGTALTHAVLHRVLVTQVQGAPAVAATDPAGADGGDPAGAPTASLLVTLAVVTRDAETVVFGAEHGTLWLSLESEGVETGGTKVTDQGNVFGTVTR